MSRPVACIAGLFSGLGTGDVLRTFASSLTNDPTLLRWALIIGTVAGVAGAVGSCRTTSQAKRDCTVVIVSWELILIAVAVPMAADAILPGSSVVQIVAFGSIVPWFFGWLIQIVDVIPRETPRSGGVTASA